MTVFNADFLKAYFVCGSQDVPEKSLVAVVQAALDAGITAYQFRDKGPQSTLTGETRRKTAQRLRDMCADAGVPFIVDDDVALAQQTAADGIHVGQSDQQIQSVVETVGGAMFIGLSCSNATEIKAADRIAGIDYYGSGPVFPTGSKADADPVIGLAGLKSLVAMTPRPIVAIGGIQEDQVDAVMKTGAKGSAVISMIAQSDDIAATVAKMRAAHE
ncbi:thiamine phosphate synthase [uncultured Secundilactobacillus sp.]|uniref:thiamine phosphate synthase n=1 Tax=uncultured Secundilactobacillus sp. TaxID=2813935 RepID=UPI0025833908|nr:thiamine phosphate synthase [uncultured Secundilactobacillus sp.]